MSKSTMKDIRKEAAASQRTKLRRYADGGSIDDASEALAAKLGRAAAATMPSLAAAAIAEGARRAGASQPPLSGAKARSPQTDPTGADDDREWI